MAGIYTNPAFVGVVVALPSSALGYLAYRHSQRVDALAAQAGIATVQSGSIGQVIDGLNKIVANLQADNEVLRASLRALAEKVGALTVECEECRRELVALGRNIPN